MTENTVTDRLTQSAKKTLTQPFAAVIKLAPEDQTPVWIDGRTDPPVISSEVPKGVSADCVWSGALDTLVPALDSERALESAYLSGRITISGDMSVMTRLTMGQIR